MAKMSRVQKAIAGLQAAIAVGTEVNNALADGHISPMEELEIAVAVVAAVQDIQGEKTLFKAEDVTKLFDAAGLIEKG